jgi:hypothetical protein
MIIIRDPWNRIIKKTENILHRLATTKGLLVKQKNSTEVFVVVNVYRYDNTYKPVSHPLTLMLK